jgi:hypothetical protein
VTVVTDADDHDVITRLDDPDVRYWLAGNRTGDEVPTITLPTDEEEF